MAAIFPADHEWTLLDTVAEQEAANFDHPTADDNAEGMECQCMRIKACGCCATQAS